MEDNNNNSKKKVCVIGGGIAGLTTCLYLKKEGYDVICIEANKEEGFETSLLNGSIICPSLTSPWANITTISYVITSIINSSSLAFLYSLYTKSSNFIKNLLPLKNNEIGVIGEKSTNNSENDNNNDNVKLEQVYPQYQTTEIEWDELWKDPYFWCWLLDFMFASISNKKYQESYNASYQLSVFSKKCYLDLINEINYEPGVAIGSLQLFSNDKKRHSQFNLEKPVIGCQSLSNEELKILETTLTTGQGGAILNKMDCSGDIKKYCSAIKLRCEDLGVKFIMNTKVLTWKLDTKSKQNKMKSLFITSTSQSSHVTNIEADYYIFATGNEMNQVTLDLDDIQISWPMRGFAIDAPISNETLLSSSLSPSSQLSSSISTSSSISKTNLVKHILADDNRKVYISPLTPNYVRISGIVDIPPRKYNKNVVDIVSSQPNFPSIKPMTDKQRFRSISLLLTAMEVLPLNYLTYNPYDKNYRYYSCYRPQTFDDLPVFGRSTNFSNVYYNGGHGHLGFTRATGTSKLLVELFKNNLENDEKEIKRSNKNLKHEIYIPQSDESKHLNQINIELFSPKRCNNLFLKAWRKICRVIF